MLERVESRPLYRPLCLACLRPQVACFCARLLPFDSEPEIVLLIHPRETKKAIGTARLTHHSIRNSKLIRGFGEDFDRNVLVKSLVSDPSRQAVVLFPGSKAISLDGANETLEPLRTAGRKLRVFIIDGTWSEARKMITRSRLLASLPQIMFQPRQASNYRIRKQPKSVCVSTLEAVHALLERLESRGLGRLPVGNAHNRLLEVFAEMVDFQLKHVQPPRRPRANLV